MKKSNIIVGLVVVMVLVGGAGWWAFGSSGEGKEQSVPQISTSSGSQSSGSQVEQGGTSGEKLTTDTSGGFVASKNGTKYFPTSCGSAKTIKEENKIIFQSTSEAESAGYTPAKNC